MINEQDINIVSVAPNDSLVATGSQDKLVKIWDSNDFTLKGMLKNCELSMSRGINRYREYISLALSVLATASLAILMERQTKKISFSCLSGSEGPLTRWIPSV